MFDQCRIVWPSLIVVVLLKLSRNGFVELLQQTAHIADEELALICAEEMQKTELNADPTFADF